MDEPGKSKDKEKSYKKEERQLPRVRLDQLQSKSAEQSGICNGTEALPWHQAAGGDRAICPVFFALSCLPLIFHKGSKRQSPHSDHTWKQGVWQAGENGNNL